MSILSYNDITLPYSITTSFSQEDVYDDLSGTDWMCSKYDISVQCHIDIAYIDTIAPAYAGMTTPDNAAEIMKAIRKDLMKPRRQLSFTFNGSELIPDNTASPGTVDVQNGPKPISCSYTRLNNTHFIINFHITAWYWESFSSSSTLGEMNNKPGHVALYNRWTESVDIDKTMVSTRTRDGKYIIRSDNADGKTADEIRSDLAVVGVPSGFVRESAKYTISPDGLGISYHITDKETFKKMPPYTYEAHGTYTETASRLQAKVYGEVNLKLIGAPNNAISPQNELIRIGILIVHMKLKTRGYDPKSKLGILEHAQVIVDMYKNEVTFHWRVMLPVKKDRVSGGFKTPAQANAAVTALSAFPIVGTLVSLASVLNNTGPATFPVDPSLPEITAFCGDMTTTPLSDDNNNAPPRYLDRGSFGLVLQAAKYWDPDIPDTVLAPDNIVDTSNAVTSIDKVQHNHGVKVGRAGVEKEV